MKKFRIRVIETVTREYIGEVEAEDKGELVELFDAENFVRDDDPEMDNERREYELYDIQDADEAFRRF